MRRKYSSSDSGANRESQTQDGVSNIRTKKPRIYDNVTRRLLQLGVTLAIITFIGLIIRYAVQEFDPSVSTITVTTSKINNRDIASLSVSKHFLERILGFIEESIAIVAAIIPLGFPLCISFNKYFAKMRAGSDRIEINDDNVLNMIPKYVVIGDIQACQLPESTRLRPLVRDTIYQLIKIQLKPKLIVEDSFDEARKLGIRIGLIRRDHHKLAVIKSVDLLKYITDNHGDIKQGKVRYLLSRMKIMSQSTPADKSLLIYLMKHCESLPNENLAYLGYSFTDPEAMRIADCALTFNDCDDDDVRKSSQVILKSENSTFTDLYLFIIVCLLYSNITQSYALYQISASVSCCLYRFLAITVFQEQIISHSQFTLLITVQQIFAIFAIMTKWLSSLPQNSISSSMAEMSHEATEDSIAASSSHLDGNFGSKSPHRRRRNRSRASSSGLDNLSEQQHATSIPMNRLTSESRKSLANSHYDDDTLETSHQLESSSNQESEVDFEEDQATPSLSRRRNNLSSGRQSRSRIRSKIYSSDSHHIHLSGIDFDQSLINSQLLNTYKQTFHNTSLVDDVTYRLARLHIAYQVLVMIIIMIFGNAMFQLNTDNNKQHQTLAFNSLMMNNIFNLANCFNQFGKFNMKSGFKSHPFFVCVLLMAIFVQVTISELNSFGLANLNPTQWFVCFVFAALSALISPLTGQQKREQQVSSQNHKMGHPNIPHYITKQTDYSPIKSHRLDHSARQDRSPKLNHR